MFILIISNAANKTGFPFISADVQRALWWKEPIRKIAGKHRSSSLNSFLPGCIIKRGPL